MWVLQLPLSTQYNFNLELALSLFLREAIKPDGQVLKEANCATYASS